MKIATLIVSLTLILSQKTYCVEQKVYSWKDKNGVLVFSDTPRPGATEVKLNTQNITIPAESTDILNQSTPAQAITYKALIVSPADESTVRENTGSVYVNARITPRFANGFKVQLMVDGAAYGELSNTSTFALRDVYRGAHTLQVKLFDPNNKLVTVSPVSTFYMHRASVN